MHTTRRSHTAALLIAIGLGASLWIGVGFVLTSVASASAGRGVATVRPNPDEQTLIAATAQPTAPSSSVRPNPDEQTAAATLTLSPRSEVVSGDGYGSPKLVVVRLSRQPGGFRWDDAGIGAASGFGLSLVALAGMLALFQRRTRRTAGSAA